MKLSVVVPCFNEEDNVQLFYECATNILSEKLQDFEIVFVNDGSKDNTFKILKNIYNENKFNIKVINFSRNFGKEAAMYAGLEMTRGEYVAIIDADMQQDPKYLVKMMEFLDANEEYDSVAAFQRVRKEGKILGFYKKMFYRIINKLTDVEFIQGASDFRMFRRNMVNAILEVKEYFRFSKGIFSWVGFETYYLPYDVKERANGTSKWSFRRLFAYAIDGIISFTTAPLRWVTIVGILASSMSILYFIVVIIQKLFFSIDIPGYPTIVTLILLIGGMQLYGIGMIGEYLARTYVETKRRPIYLKKQTFNYEDNLAVGENTQKIN